MKFREDVRQAFDDMVSAGGLASWRCEEVGTGRRKSYRYHYVHALERQGTLNLFESVGAQEAEAERPA